VTTPQFLNKLEATFLVSVTYEKQHRVTLTGDMILCSQKCIAMTAENQTFSQSSVTFYDSDYCSGQHHIILHIYFLNK